MAAKHITIAQTEGPKAGFNAYIETLERAGLPQVQEALNEIRAKGNKKAQFEFYCAKFGKFFGNNPVKSDDLDDLRAKIEALTAQLEAREVGVVVEAPATPKKARKLGRTKRTTTTNTEGKLNLWRPWAIKKYGIKAKVGTTFTYHSKKANANTTHEVVQVTSEGVLARRVK